MDRTPFVFVEETVTLLSHSNASTTPEQTGHFAKFGENVDRDRFKWFITAQNGRCTVFEETFFEGAWRPVRLYGTEPEQRLQLFRKGFCEHLVVSLLSDQDPVAFNAANDSFVESFNARVEKLVKSFNKYVRIFSLTICGQTFADKVFETMSDWNVTTLTINKQLSPAACRYKQAMQARNTVRQVFISNSNHNFLMTTTTVALRFLGQSHCNYVEIGHESSELFGVVLNFWVIGNNATAVKGKAFNFWPNYRKCLFDAIKFETQAAWMLGGLNLTIESMDPTDVIVTHANGQNKLKLVRQFGRAWNNMPNYAHCVYFL
ncbi:hypothetical protein L596_000184 [Steinernema carpocapsae]|uniref:Uncharacterized protein n=1 Tax=Steinernema carpocapsae TaxID=34508 RepID=A0A4U8UH56_STECR|nr:hypothetical protein L596_000184 [Steinernema carpocapsae]